MTVRLTSFVFLALLIGPHCFLIDVSICFSQTVMSVGLIYFNFEPFVGICKIELKSKLT